MPMIVIRLATGAVVVAALAVAWSAAATIQQHESDRNSGVTLPVSHTYVLTQAFCLPPQADPANPGACKPQEIAVGASLEIQLPGTPATWTLGSVPPNLAPTGTMRMPNPFRIEGTNEILIWKFDAVRAGDAAVVLREFPPTISNNPAGTFTFTIHVR